MRVKMDIRSAARSFVFRRMHFQSPRKRPSCIKDAIGVPYHQASNRERLNADRHFKIATSMIRCHPVFKYSFRIFTISGTTHKRMRCYNLFYWLKHVSAYTFNANSLYLPHRDKYLWYCQSNVATPTNTGYYYTARSAHLLGRGRSPACLELRAKQLL